MEGCLANLIKYAVFTTNIIVFILSLTVIGLCIWVLVDSPSFLDLFDTAKDVLGNTDDFQINIYTTAVYVLIAVAVVVAIITFFGCCGAIKESKCMLGTFFVMLLALFIASIVGAVMGYQGDLDSSIEAPLNKALAKYKDNPTNDSPEMVYKNAWNQAQMDFLCCGIVNAKDWATIATDAGFQNGYNKPSGCCEYKRGASGKEDMSEAEKAACRKANVVDNMENYYYEGCWTIFKDEIENAQDILVGVTIGIIVIMFLNMLFSFALCTMAE